MATKPLTLPRSSSVSTSSVVFTPCSTARPRCVNAARCTHRPTRHYSGDGNSVGSPVPDGAQHGSVVTPASRARRDGGSLLGVAARVSLL